MNSEKIFETRQRAAELLKDAVAIWRQSDQSDYLEGLENDPVFSLLMMALAYQEDEVESEIEKLKEETLYELARLLASYEAGHATPATMVVSTALQQGVAERVTTADNVFMLASTHPFIPLLKTRVLNAVVHSVTRLDGRRWKVRFDFSQPVSDLQGFSFAVDGLNFRDLTVTIGKQQLPLIKPWDYSELPFNDCFSPHNMLYNRQQVCNMSMLPIDLFARHNVRMFCVDKHPSTLLPAMEAAYVELVFEFTGIANSFLFDKTHLLLNTMVLVAKISPEGKIVWKKMFGDTSNDTYADDIKPLGDTGFAVMFWTGLIHLEYGLDSRYWGDSMCNNVMHPQVNPYDTPGRRFDDGAIDTYMAFDFNGNVTETLIQCGLKLIDFIRLLKAHHLLGNRNQTEFHANLFLLLINMRKLLCSELSGILQVIAK